MFYQVLYRNLKCQEGEFVSTCGWWIGQCLWIHISWTPIHLAISCLNAWFQEVSKLWDWVLKAHIALRFDKLTCSSGLPNFHAIWQQNTYYLMTSFSWGYVCKTYPLCCGMNNLQHKCMATKEWTQSGNKLGCIQMCLNMWDNLNTPKRNMNQNQINGYMLPVFNYIRN